MSVSKSKDKEYIKVVVVRTQDEGGWCVVVVSNCPVRVFFFSCLFGSFGSFGFYAPGSLAKRVKTGII